MVMDIFRCQTIDGKELMTCGIDHDLVRSVRGGEVARQQRVTADRIRFID